MFAGMLDMAEDCLKHANDLSGLLLINRIPEAAPNKVFEIIALWRKDLKKVNSVILIVSALGTFMIVSRVDEIKYGCLEAFSNKEAELNELIRSHEGLGALIYARTVIVVGSSSKQEWDKLELNTS
nr:coatomer subunit beta'-2-like [Tanacetum cinerariifolium]